MISKKEKARLTAVARYKDIYISRGRELRDIVEIAADICQMPIAFISLMEKHEQIINFKIGTNLSTASREDSFCKHVIAQGKIMMIKDTSKDERFQNNRWVIAKPGIGFYAGIPLSTRDGFHIGSLCVYDRHPNFLSQKQLKMMETLARQINYILEAELNFSVLNDHLHEIEQQKKHIEEKDMKLRSFFESSVACYALLDLQMNLVDYNRAMSDFLGNSNIELGHSFYEMVFPLYKENFRIKFNLACAGIRTIDELNVNYTAFGEIWWKVVFEPMIDQENRVIGVSINCLNITDHKNNELKILDQNQSLLKIAHMQSHEFRRPVASIKGIMNIIRADNYQATQDCLTYLELAVNELDEKIHNVVNMSKTS